MYFPALLPTHRSLSSPLGGDPAEIGLVYALGPLGGLVVYPIAGYLADHVSRARLIAFTGYFSSLTFLIYIVAPSWHWLAVARRLWGFAVFQHPGHLRAHRRSTSGRGRALAIIRDLQARLHRHTAQKNGCRRSSQFLQ